MTAPTQDTPSTVTVLTPHTTLRVIVPDDGHGGRLSLVAVDGTAFCLVHESRAGYATWSYLDLSSDGFPCGHSRLRTALALAMEDASIRQRKVAERATEALLDARDSQRQRDALAALMTATERHERYAAEARELRSDPTGGDAAQTPPPEATGDGEPF